MSGIPQSLNDLIIEFSKLPGIGKKTAERLAVYVLQTSSEKANEFSDGIKSSSQVGYLLITLGGILVAFGI